MEVPSRHVEVVCLRAERRAVRRGEQRLVPDLRQWLGLASGLGLGAASHASPAVVAHYAPLAPQPTLTTPPWDLRHAVVELLLRTLHAPVILRLKGEHVHARGELVHIDARPHRWGWGWG